MTAPAEPLLAVMGLEAHFPIRRGLLRRQVGAVRAVDGVSFAIPQGTTLGLVGPRTRSKLARALFARRALCCHRGRTALSRLEQKRAPLAAFAA